MAQAVEWYKQMPIITRSHLTAVVLTSVGCSLEIISPYHLYLNPKRIFEHYEFRRLITNFLYLHFDFLFYMFFFARCCKLLGENSFRGRTADFLYMLLFGATVSTAIVFVGGMVPYVSESFASIIFLSNSLTFMMVLLGFSLLVGVSVWVDLLGMIADHAYFFLEEVCRRMTGRRPLKTPSFIKSLFAEDAVLVAQPTDVRFAPPMQDLHQD